MAQRKIDGVVNEAVAMHQNHVKISSLTQELAQTALAELAWRFDNTDYLNYGSLSTDKLLELAPKLIKMYSVTEGLEKVVKEFESKETGWQPPADNGKAPVNSLEIVRCDETFVQNGPGQEASSRQDAQAEDKGAEDIEGSVELQKIPSRRKWEKRIITPVNGTSPESENHSDGLKSDK